MNAETNSALYYPSIEFQNYEWLWTASLLWDKIYRIQPDNYTPDEPDNIVELCDGGEIGIPLHPSRYAGEVATEFLANVHGNKWHAAALDHRSNAEYSKINFDKMDVKVRNMVTSNGLAKAFGDWMYVPKDFEVLYMSYLANKMARKNSLQLVTDKDAAWTSQTYFSNPIIETEICIREAPVSLAVMFMRNVLPENLLDVSARDLLQFREKYKDERRNYIGAIRNASKQFANCHDARIANDLLHDLQKDVDQAIKDYQKSMLWLKACKFGGALTLSLPISTSVLSMIMPAEMTNTVSIGANLAIGALCGFISYQHDGKRLSKESQYSYLVYASNLVPTSSFAESEIYKMNRSMNEFIND